MSDGEEVDYTNVDWEEQEGEIEALEMIFPDEIVFKEKKPFKLDIQVNSNAEADDNHLKVQLCVELPHDYPNRAPFLRLVNKTPDFLNNTTIDKLETEIREKAEELIGGPMIFDICEHLRESIAEINDVVLGKYNKILAIQAEKEALEKTPMMTNMDQLDYTPVTKETFSVWCDEFMGVLRLQEEMEKTEQDKRLTGKQLFLENQSEKNMLDDLILDDGEEEVVVDSQ